MLRFFYIAAITVLALANEFQKPHYDLKDALELFEKFRREYNRVYDDEEDMQIHYQAFLKTLERINEANEQSDTAVFDINNFADYTLDEMKALLGVKSKKDKKRKKFCENDDASKLEDLYGIS